MRAWSESRLSRWRFMPMSAKSAKSIAGVFAVVCIVPLATLACVLLNAPQYVRN